MKSAETGIGLCQMRKKPTDVANWIVRMRALNYCFKLTSVNWYLNVVIAL